MASKTQYLAFARRVNAVESGTWTAARRYSHFAPARRRALYNRSRPVCGTLRDRRAFSSTLLRTFADVDDSFDLRQQDRESDEVDVCIVGGGMCS